ncbi:MAG: outer membrane beta-barrel protein [Desulfobulbus sp.]|uniref:outer membrane protein n=1 Tax=Desulfobulbus sp. TaxID=895 RepID=UPI002845D8CC|nr:outer membrane beta-barrel protein [Desulfobulbus sp.]MDR2550350.1 outer membrane beta-barrel protein [Desulfobulbus sp.]
MKKVLSVMAASAFVLTAGVALAGGPGKKMGPGCPEACQKQIDDLQSSQAQQNEQLSAHGKQLQNHEGRITDLEKAFADAWYVRLGVRAAWTEQKVQGPLGVNSYDIDSDAGFGGAIAFGREFAMYQALGKFRAEVELAKQGSDLEDGNTFGFRQGGFGKVTDGSVDITTVFLNGYYELPVYDAFSIYFMAGVGYAKYDVDTTLAIYDNAGNYATSYKMVDGSDNVFAYKAGAGITYNFTDQIAGDLGYEYLGVADTDLADSINGHNVVASVRFKF